MKTRFKPLQTLKKTFKGLDSGGLEMHQNTFLTTPDVKKCMKTRFKPLQTLKKNFQRT